MLAAAVAALLAVAPAAARAPNVNYALKCQGCHMYEGVSPEAGRIPPLKDTVGHLARLPESRRYLVNVPGIHNSGLDETETAELLNWVIATYAGRSLPASFEPFTAAEISRWRAEAPDDVMALRAKVRELLGAQGHAIVPYP
jgi:hypothetical protein